MSIYDPVGPRPLRTYLESDTVRDLKPLAALCGATSSGTRKDQLIQFIENVMTSSAGVRRMWDQLDDASRNAIAMAVHNGGRFDEAAFEARFGQEIIRPRSRSGWYLEPGPFDLFVYEGYIPKDILPLLEPWVPRPEPFRLKGREDTPVALVHEHTKIPVMRAETEWTGPQDLAALLRLIDLGDWHVSMTSGLPSAASVRKLLPLLSEGDYWPHPDRVKAADTIRPVGLSIFALYGGLATVVNREAQPRVEVTALGRRWLNTGDPALLLEALDTWTQSSGFDELSRISELHGQRGRYAVFIPPSQRKERIIEALSWCPVGAWISTEEFFRALFAWELQFNVEVNDYSGLYLGRDQEYGSLNKVGRRIRWRVVTGIYTLAILWEYLASIGALDIVYVDPEDADYEPGLFDFAAPSLSLFDGLWGFRINDLGAYLFGQHAAYTPYVQTRPPFLRIDDDLVVHIVDPAQVTPADRLLLGSIGTPTDDDTLRLELDSLLAAIEQERDLDNDLRYLQEWHVGPMPEAAIALFKDAQARSRAFSAPEPALRIEAGTAELAELSVQDPKLRRISQLAGDRTIVIPANRERAFRNRMRELGYVLPKADGSAS